MAGSQTAPLDGEREEVMALVSGASLEMSPREQDAIPAATRPRRLCLGVSSSSAPPAVSYHDIVDAAVALRRRGLEPVPHVAARGLTGFTQLNDMLARAAVRGRRSSRAGDRRRSRSTLRAVPRQLRRAVSGFVRNAVFGNIEPRRLSRRLASAHPLNRRWIARSPRQAGFDAAVRVRDTGDHAVRVRARLGAWLAACVAWP